MGKDPNNVFNIVKQNIIDFFSREIESQVLLHFKDALSHQYLELTTFSIADIATVISEIDGVYASIDKNKIFNDIKKDFQNIIENGDYNGILRVFNLKNALIPNSKVCEETGVRNKEEFRKLVITLLKRNDRNSQIIKDAIMSCIITSPMA